MTDKEAMASAELMASEWAEGARMCWSQTNAKEYMLRMILARDREWEKRVKELETAFKAIAKPPPSQPNRKPTGEDGEKTTKRSGWCSQCGSDEHPTSEH